jgi:hypothetical protein
MHPDLLPAVVERNALLDELRALVAAAPPAAWTRPTANPGWDAKDLLAHLATGDWVMQRTVRALLAGDDPAGVWERLDIDAGNAERIAAARGRSVAGLLDDLRAQQTASLALWELLTDRRLTAPLPNRQGGVWTLRDYLCGFPGHDRLHIGQLRAALGVAR